MPNKFMGVELLDPEEVMIPTDEQYIMKTVCCDCHLTHTEVFDPVQIKGKLFIRQHTQRDEVATRLRRFYERTMKAKRKQRSKKK
jgi:hypothetical protein